MNVNLNRVDLDFAFCFLSGSPASAPETTFSFLLAWDHLDGGDDDLYARVNSSMASMGGSAEKAKL